MKYVIALLLSLIVGAAVGLLLILNNPLASSADKLSAGGANIMLPTSGQGTATVMQSGTGYAWVGHVPADAKAPDIKGMKSAVTVLLSTANGSREVAYMARIRSLTNETRPLLGDVTETSLWHVVVPSRGSFAIYSEDNVWPVIDALLVPFARGESWAGKIDYTSTKGPQGQSAQVIGLSGEFLGQRGTARLDQTIRTATAGRGITDESGALYIDLESASSPASLPEESLASNTGP
ncbi:MAG: hypothetical protein AAF290_15555 [Pseudomonadota bacterium]